MAYHFKLETLLTYRRNLEEQVQLKLAREQATLLNHRNRLNDMQIQRRQSVEELEQLKQKTITGAMYSFYMDSILLSEELIERQITMIAAQEKVVARIREELLEKVRQRKIIERVREKDYLNYLQEEQRQELKENDEQAVLLFGRNEGLL